MKILFDFFPIFLFFATYKVAGIYAATVVAMAATVLQVVFTKIKHGRLEPMHLVNLFIIGIFGGATLWLAEEIFIKWKPTAVNWVLSVVFLASQYIGKKPLIERVMGNVVKLPEIVWRRLNFAWVVFFIFSGGANLFVVYHYDTDTWVNFKLFGLLGLTAVFAILQSLYISRHIKPEENTP